MLQTLRGLYELQSIDAKIHEIEGTLQNLPLKLKELEQKASELSMMVQEISDERTSTHKEAKNIEGQVQTENLKVRKWEARLNEIRNQREYLALSREVEASKRQNRDLEEQIGELNRKREEFDAKTNELIEQATAVEAEIETERAEVETKTQELEEEKSQLEVKREELLPTVEKAILRKYDFIRKKRAGVGIATVSGGSCQACYMQLPPQLYNVLQRGDSMEQCPSCSRIIIWDKFLEADEASEEQHGDAGAQASP